MRKILLAVMALAVLAGCANRLRKKLAALEEQGAGMLIENNGETTSYHAPGVTDLLRLNAEEPERLNGATVESVEECVKILQNMSAL